MAQAGAVQTNFIQLPSGKIIDKSKVESVGTNFPSGKTGESCEVQLTTKTGGIFGDDGKRPLDGKDCDALRNELLGKGKEKQILRDSGACR